ncbi:MAG TPA: outer membrane beta-barrel protein [Flavobacterium sp.]|jgi:hypothetical protein
MKKIKTLILLAGFSFAAHAQYDYRDSNRIGISIGLNQFTLNTSDVESKPGTGWNGGLSVRGNFYNDFDMVYAIQFSENNFEVATVNGFAEEQVKFKLPSAQISLLLSYKIVENHLSIELGPMIQVNGKLTFAEDDEENIVSGTTLTAKEFSDISKFNFYPTVGITAGLKQFRVNVMYQYGVTNILGNLDGNLTGHAGILSGSVIFYL